MSLGSKIRDIRLANNLSQADFGKIVGVSDKSVKFWTNQRKSHMLANHHPNWKR